MTPFSMTRTALAAIGLMAAVTHSSPALAQASDRPWYVGGSQEFAHESNVLGAPRGAERSDTISTTSLIGGVNTRLGRQVLFADVDLNTTRYNRLDDRNSDGYGLNLGLDWSTIERLSGTVRLNSRQRQTPFGTAGIVQTSVSNVEKTNELQAIGRIGAASLLTAEIGLGWRSADFEAPEFAQREYRQQRAGLGLIYRPSDILSLRGGVQGARTDYNNADVKATTKGVFLGARWVPTGLSTVNAQLEYSRENATAITDGFRGVTGNVSWAWQPTGRLALTTTLARVTGRDAVLLATTGLLDASQATTSTAAPAAPGTTTPPTAAPGPTAPTPAAPTAANFSRVSNQLSVSAGYQLTGKVNLSAGLSTADRRFDDITGGGKDRETGLSLGARWEALRTVNVGCDLGYTERDADTAASTDARNSRFGCSVRLRID